MYYIDVYKIYERNVFDSIHEVLSTLKNKQIKTNNSLIEKNNDMIKNPDFEHVYWSRTAIGVHKIGHDSIRLMKWLCYYDRSYYENINFYDLMGSICKYSNEVSKQ